MHPSPLRRSLPAKSPARWHLEPVALRSWYGEVFTTRFSRMKAPIKFRAFAVQVNYYEEVIYRK